VFRRAPFHHRIAEKLLVKLWYQSSTEIERLPEYKDVLVDRLSELLGEGNSVVNGMPDGTFSRFGANPVEMMRFPVGFGSLMRPVIRAARDAERQGFDVFMLGAFMPPYLREARSAVDVPVVSLGESALLTARSLGAKVCVVAITRHQAELARALVETTGVHERTVFLTYLDPPLNDAQVSGSFADGKPIIEAFSRAAAEGVAGGADVILPGESMMNEVLRLNGVRTVEDAPIVDTIHLAVAHAHMLNTLWKSGAIAPGRLYTYPRLDPAVTDAITG
jgi:Asp/Glu/hydantoin racemase